MASQQSQPQQQAPRPFPRSLDRPAVAALQHRLDTIHNQRAALAAIGERGESRRFVCRVNREERAITAADQREAANRNRRLAVHIRRAHVQESNTSVRSAVESALLAQPPPLSAATPPPLPGRRAAVGTVRSRFLRPKFEPVQTVHVTGSTRVTHLSPAVLPPLSQTPNPAGSSGPSGAAAAPRTSPSSSPAAMDRGTRTMNSNDVSPTRQAFASQAAMRVLNMKSGHNSATRPTAA